MLMMTMVLTAEMISLRMMMMMMMVAMMATTATHLASLLEPQSLHNQPDNCTPCKTLDCDKSQRCLLYCHNACPSGYYDMLGAFIVPPSCPDVKYPSTTTKEATRPTTSLPPPIVPVQHRTTVPPRKVIRTTPTTLPPTNTPPVALPSQSIGRRKRKAVIPQQGQGHSKVTNFLEVPFREIPPRDMIVSSPALTFPSPEDPVLDPEIRITTKAKKKITKKPITKIKKYNNDNKNTNSWSKQALRYKHRCLICEVTHCANCNESPETCQGCSDGYELVLGACQQMSNQTAPPHPEEEDAHKGNDGEMNVPVIAGSVVAGVLLLIGIGTGIMCLMKQKRRRRSKTVTGGCSIDLITTERIPSSVRESQSHIYGNNITLEDVDALKGSVADTSKERLVEKEIPSSVRESQSHIYGNNITLEDFDALKGTVADTSKERLVKKENKKLANMSSVEIKEINALPEAPRPPGETDSKIYDGLDPKSPSSPQPYLAVSFSKVENNANIYENTNMAVYENIQPPTPKQNQQQKQRAKMAEKKSEQKNGLNQQEEQSQTDVLYVNTAEISNIIHNKNCSIKIKQPLEKASSDCSCVDNNMEEESASEDYVLVPPSYDSVNRKNSKKSPKATRTPGFNKTADTDDSNLYLEPNKVENNTGQGIVGGHEAPPVSSEGKQDKADRCDEAIEEYYLEADGVPAAIYGNSGCEEGMYSDPMRYSSIYAVPDGV